MKKMIILLAALAGMLSFSFTEETLDLLIPGKGIENYVTINATTRTEINTKFGSDFKEIKHYIGAGNKKQLYSTEQLYKKQGVSFYFHPNNDTVFAIHVLPAYKAKTDKGIIAGKSTMQEVRDAYGTVEWSYTDTQMFLEYPGIAFYLPFDGKFPVAKETEESALTKKVSMIGITAIGE